MGLSPEDVDEMPGSRFNYTKAMSARRELPTTATSRAYFSTSAFCPQKIGRGAANRLPYLFVINTPPTASQYHLRSPQRTAGITTAALFSPFLLQAQSMA
jgi:hypothetical protein